MLNKDTLIILMQRVKYFFSGNYHGVSVGWLNKQGIELQSSLQFFIDRGYEKSLVMNALEEGVGQHEEACRVSKSEHYSERYNSECEMSKLLYVYILLEKPEIVVETGVANGISTKVIMAALEKTGGCLHSFDFDQEAASAYRGSGDWKFHLLPKKGTKKALEIEVSKIDHVDLWLHDSDHGFQWQFFEYQLAISKLSSKTGLLVSDDIDASTAWGTLAKYEKYSFKMTFDKRKFIGFSEIRSKNP